MPDTTDPILARNRTVLLDALRTAGAASAVIRYSGCGDSGNPTEIDIVTAAGQPVSGDPAVSVIREDCQYVDGQWQSTHTPADMSLSAALEAFADRAITRYHPGFENNEGGDGEITFDCAAGTVRMAHRDYYVESCCTDTEL